jgi:hypothetical protein
MSTKDNKYVVNQKLEHVDDTSEKGIPTGKIKVKLSHAISHLGR